MAANFLSINDFTDAEIRKALDAAEVYRRGISTGMPLAGRSVAMIFEKPSLRTKVSFDIAVYELGGHAIYLGRDEVGLDVREPVEDVARVLERWASAIVARVFDHRVLERFAAAAAVPVVNALSDLEHPCQAMADLLTVRQRLKRLEGVKVAYIGDANNCALSLGLGCAGTGAHFSIASPAGYGFTEAAIESIERRGQGNGVQVHTTVDPEAAVHGADVIYTDVWTSMGQEAESEKRLKAFQGYQVNEALLKQANQGAILLHPMPAHYGEEVSPGMLDHPQSAAYDQAENRLHAQKAVLRMLVAGE
ncbi:MAG: ornithine carbamoyltransferase [Dehalococcoidia bacterium]